MNNKGVTLLEALAAITIMSLAMYGFTGMIKMQVNLSKNITNSLNNAATNLQAAQAAKKPAKFYVVYFQPGQCTAVDNYWGRYQNANVVDVYTDGNCVNSLGSLNQNNNSTYFNDITSTLWVISSSVSGLRAVVINLNN